MKKLVEVLVVTFKSNVNATPSVFMHVQASTTRRSPSEASSTEKQRPHSLQLSVCPMLSLLAGAPGPVVRQGNLNLQKSVQASQTLPQPQAPLPDIPTDAASLCPGQCRFLIPTALKGPCEKHISKKQCELLRSKKRIHLLCYRARLSEKTL